MTEHATPQQIEAQIARDRAALAATMDRLQDRVSIDTLAKEALGLIQTNASSYTKSVDEAVRANPLALALTGIGVAWLIFGAKKPPQHAAPKPETLSRWEDDGGPVVEAGALHDEWARETDGLRARATAALHKIEADSKAAVASVGQTLRGGAEQARDFAAERAVVVADFTATMQRSFRHGLDDLSDVAQERIAAAREAAYAARLWAARVGRGGAPDVGRMIEDHPMVVGAVALALGAALGSALPRTQVEDNAFGAERNRLMDAAARQLAEERARAGILAEDLGAEIANSARDLASGVVDTVTEKTAVATARIGHRVAEEMSDSEEPAPDPVAQGRNGQHVKA